MLDREQGLGSCYGRNGARGQQPAPDPIPLGRFSL